eukprot:m.60201 g.60201  ORF g.60201 m.60201 type:complete len:366 (+) comp13270_c0_seq1:453-1550(+)
MGREEGERRLVAVVLGLERTLSWDTEVLGLVSRENGELNTELVKVSSSDFLIQLLGQDVDANCVFVSVGPELNLGKDLVGEGVGHDKAWVTSGATKVDKTTLGQEDNVTAIAHLIAIDLWLNVHDSLGVSLEPCNVNLAVKVTNVANNRVVLHLLKVLRAENTLAASGGDKDGGLLAGLLHSGHLVTLHGGLESVDGVNLGDQDASTHTTKRLSATLTDITIASNDGSLTSNHDICGALETIEQGLTAAVQVVKLGLGDRVVDIDGGDLEGTGLEHLVEVVNASSGFLGETLDARKELRVLLVNQVGEITSVIEDHVEGLTVGEHDRLLNAPEVFLIGLTLPGIDGDTSLGNSGSSLVLGGEDVA